MLLFKLPWLCHGIRLNLNNGQNNARNDEESQQSLSMKSGSDTEINKQVSKLITEKNLPKINNSTIAVKSKNALTQEQLQTFLNSLQYGASSIHGH